MSIRMDEGLARATDAALLQKLKQDGPGVCGSKIAQDLDINRYNLWRHFPLRAQRDKDPRANRPAKWSIHANQL